MYAFNIEFAATIGHAGSREYDEVKQQALEALQKKGLGKKDVSIFLHWTSNFH